MAPPLAVGEPKEVEETPPVQTPLSSRNDAVGVRANRPPKTSPTVTIVKY
jgi:hypothetical protein